MIRAIIAAVARQERHSVTAALGLAMVAILFAQMILPGAARLLTGAVARASNERPVSP